LGERTDVGWEILSVLAPLGFRGAARVNCRLSDNANRVTVLGLGFGILIAADLVLALTNGIAGVTIGVGLWGLHMGFTQGLLATLIADTAPSELRGTAYGVFNLLVGLAMLVASVLAGALWDVIGSQATFLAGAAFTLLALVCLPATRRIAHDQGIKPKRNWTHRTSCH
jgi:MFS family permease